jgi:hypothetical protein
MKFKYTEDPPSNPGLYWIKVGEHPHTGEDVLDSVVVESSSFGLCFRFAYGPDYQEHLMSRWGFRRVIVPPGFKLVEKRDYCADSTGLYMEKKE